MYKKLLKIFGRLSFMILIPLASLVHVYLNRYRPGTHNIKIFIDDLIPFNKYFSLPYQFMVVFISTVLLYFAIVDYNYYFKLLACLLLGMFVCFIILYFFPTTVNRPIISGDYFFSNFTRSIYASDNPFDCFPSIHVLSAYLPFLFIFKYNKNGIMKIYTFVGFIIITLSTFFVKQHYVLDALASLILGTVLFIMLTNETIWSKMPFRKTMSFLIPSKLKNDIFTWINGNTKWIKN
jgi:hypothetical protein